MAKKVVKNDITVTVLHVDDEIGKSWKSFIEEMFTVDLPENYRDLGLAILTSSIAILSDEEINEIQKSSWKLFLFSHSMLKELKDNMSPLSRSGLFEINSDRVIVLVLGDQDDVSFQEEVRRVLYVYRNFVDFNLVMATSPENIFSNIIDIVSPLYVVFHPNTLSSEDRDQYVTLIANKPYPKRENTFFQVQFCDANRTTEVEARLFNSCTLLLNNPGLPAGMIDVKVFACSRDDEDKNDASNRYQLGETMKVWFQSDLDKVNAVLEKNMDPFKFLCQALHLDPKTNASAAEAVDKCLTESFRKHVPENQLARVFGTDQGIETDGQEGNRKEYAPTLLHFAAMHGLCNLTAQLLRCPGSIKAFGTTNCDGDFPTNLAEKSGHWDLKDYMESYMEVSAMVDYEMGSTKNTSQMMAQMVTGQYLSLTESIYEDRADLPNPWPEGYVPMKPLVSKDDIECYDSPFIVPIPCHDDTPNYERILAQLIESEDTYMSFDADIQVEFAACDGIEEEAPPEPLPRDSCYPEEPPPLPSPSNFHPPPLPDPDRFLNDKEKDAQHTGTESLAPSGSAVGNRAGGADRVTYGTLAMPKMHAYVSPAQRELILLQQKVKNQEITTNQAVIRFKEWERKHKEQAASFQFQQECLQRVRNSLMKSKEMKKKRGEDDSLEITGPIFAGSSTYDVVLRKTHKSEPKEAIYGACKPPTVNEGFARRSTHSSLASSSLSSCSTSSGSTSRDFKMSYTRQQDKAAQNVYFTRQPPSAPPIPPRDQSTPSQPPCVPPRPPLRW